MHPGSDLLEKARFAFVMGRAGEARSLLETLVQREPDNGDAWYLLAQVVDEPALRADYYQRARRGRSIPEAADLTFAPGLARQAPPPRAVASPPPRFPPPRHPAPRRIGATRGPRLLLLFLPLTMILGIAFYIVGLGPQAAPRQSLGLARPRLAGQPGEAAIQRGNAYFDAGKFEQARSEYATATRLEPDYAVGHYNHGAAYRIEGAYAKAIPHFSRALALEPGYNNVYYYRGEAYVLNGQPQEALADLKIAAERDAQALFALYLLAAAHHELGQDAEALGDLDAAARMYSGRPLGFFPAGLAAQIRGDHDQALADFRAFLEQTNGYTALEALSRKYINSLEAR